MVVLSGLTQSLLSPSLQAHCNPEKQDPGEFVYGLESFVLAV